MIEINYLDLCFHSTSSKISSLPLEIKKRRIVRKVLDILGLSLVGWNLKFGAINSDNLPTNLSSGHSKTETVNDDKQSLTESQSVRSIRVQTGSGAILETRGGDLKKFGPGARAKADARRTVNSKKPQGSGSSILPGAYGYTPQ